MKKHAGRLSAAVVLAAGMFLSAIEAQDTAMNQQGSPSPGIQSQRLVDAHTAGVLPKGYYSFNCQIYPAGDPSLGSGITLGLTAGLTNRLNIGLSYGGEGLIGRSKNVRFNPLPGCLIKYRIFEENYFMPGIALGFDNQGTGGIADSATYGYRGYIYKSPGFFAALSKNYLLFTVIELGLHGAVDYSMEEVDKVKWPNAYAGMDLGFNEDLTFAAEYDFGLNVKDPGASTYARPQDGYLNAALKYALTRNFVLEFDARDLLEKRTRTDGSTIGWDRELKITYISHI